MFLKCELFYPLIETYSPLQLYTENIRDASDSCILNAIIYLLKELKVKPVFHFNRIVTKRSVFHCFVNTQAKLMIWTQ